MSKRQPDLLIEDIISSGDKILSYTNNLTFNEFSKDSKTIDAVVRNFEIIGEAANRLPDDYKKNIQILTGTGLLVLETVLFIIISV